MPFCPSGACYVLNEACGTIRVTLTRAPPKGTVVQKEALTGQRPLQKARPEYYTSRFVYRTLWWIINLLVRLVFRYRAQGQDNMPDGGPVIIVVNHLHLSDPGMVVCAVRRQIVTLAAGKWLDHGLVRAFLRGAGTIFVRRGEVDRKALRACLDVLGRGMALAIAPEGTRSRTGQLQRAKAGVAYIARQSNAVIVPIASWGQERLSEWRPWRRPRCQTVIGRPFQLDFGEEKANTERLQELSDAIMVQIARLLPESYRGYYANQAARYQGEDVPLGIVLC